MTPHPAIVAFREKFVTHCSDGDLISDFKNGKEIKVSAIEKHFTTALASEYARGRNTAVDIIEKFVNEVEGGRYDTATNEQKMRLWRETVKEARASDVVENLS